MKVETKINLMNGWHHWFEFAAGKDWWHDASHCLPFFSCHHQQHSIKIFVGLHAQLNISSINKMIKIFDQNMFGNINISNNQETRSKNSVFSNNLFIEKVSHVVFWVSLDQTGMKTLPGKVNNFLPFGSWQFWFS